MTDSYRTLDAHFEHENYFNMRALLGRHGIVATDNKKYRVDAVRPVYEDGKATASFD